MANAIETYAIEKSIETTKIKINAKTCKKNSLLRDKNNLSENKRIFPKIADNTP